MWECVADDEVIFLAGCRFRLGSGLIKGWVAGVLADGALQLTYVAAPSGICANSLSFWQIRTIGHTYTGNCICLPQYLVNPVCPVTGHSRPVNSVAFSPDGKHVVSGSADNLVKICNAETGVEVSIFVAVLV